METPILEMKSITKEFPGVKALDDVTFSVRKGEIHCLVGENGAGKSTLMKVLSGVHPHGTYTGDIVIEGELQKFNGIRESESSDTIRAPARTMPFFSSSNPTMKPGSSQKYTSGKWNVSHSCIRRAVFSPAALSIEPPRNRGLLIITPTG